MIASRFKRKSKAPAAPQILAPLPKVATFAERLQQIRDADRAAARAAYLEMLAEFLAKPDDPGLALRLGELADTLSVPVERVEQDAARYRKLLEVRARLAVYPSEQELAKATDAARDAEQRAREALQQAIADRVEAGRKFSARAGLVGSVLQLEAELAVPRLAPAPMISGRPSIGHDTEPGNALAGGAP